MRKPLAVVVSLVGLAAGVSGFGLQSAQGGLDLRERYTKHEYRIAMRDGVKLFTSVYVPKDTSARHPIILRRTPYSVAPYGEDQFPDQPDRQRRRYFERNYIVVFQDVRGRYMSEGTFVDVRPYLGDTKDPRAIDETTDTWDTVDWLVKNVAGNNGRVGISGVSYPGFYSSMGAIDAHPAVKAVSPQAPVSTWMGGDDFFHNGALLLSHAFDFYGGFGWPRPDPKSAPDPRFDHKTPDGYDFFLAMGPLPNADARYFKGQVAFWNEIARHPQWDAFWEARNVLPRLRRIKPAMLVVGGWFDTENLFGALNTYAAIEANNPAARNALVMGPWSHGQWSRDEGRRLGDIDFGGATSDFYTDEVEVPFFRAHLEEEVEPAIAEATVFETGANQWHRLASWPPKEAEPRKFYLHGDGTISPEPPANAAGLCRQYVSDPDKPVPYTAKVAHWYDPAFMVEDQRFASRRPDVLVYQSEPLSEELRVAGPITATLFVSTTGTDSDWIVKLIDRFPDEVPAADPKAPGPALGGYQMLVRGDVMRGKFRNGLSEPSPLLPGSVTKVEFTLQDAFHRFKAGHRLMVQVQSTWFPMIDRNPQVFTDIYQARPADFRKATQRVCSSLEASSALTLRVLAR